MTKRGGLKLSYFLASVEGNCETIVTWQKGNVPVEQTTSEQQSEIMWP